MDPMLTTFASLLLAAVVGAAIWHTVVKHYIWATVGSALSVGLIEYWAFALWRGTDPSHWTLLAANIMFAAAIALGVGIPFNRRRTGRGLGEH
jgi:hypothetical protein